MTTRNVRRTLVSLAGIIGKPVRNQAGEVVGRLVDVVARVHGDERYPPVTGLVVRVGGRRAFLDAGTIESVDHSGVRLRTARLDLRDFRRRPGELLLARDLLDHQLVDVDGVQVIRAADLYLAEVATACAWLVSTSVCSHCCASWDRRRYGAARRRTG